MWVCFWFFRVRKAEECFKQAREKASYNVKPKHAAGIVGFDFYCSSLKPISTTTCLVFIEPMVQIVSLP